jgi:mycoredoxin
MQDKVIVYGRPTCPSIPLVRDTLEQAEVDYEYVDITSDFEAKEWVKKINGGYESVPTLVFPDGDMLTEPSPAELQRKLEKLGYQAGPPAWQAWIQRLFTHPLVRVLGVGLLMAGLLADIEPLLISGAVTLAIGLLASRL